MNEENLLKIFLKAFLYAAEKTKDNANFEEVLKELKEMRASMQKDGVGLREKAEYIKKLAKSLWKLKIIKPFLESITDEIPKFWGQLTTAQKTKVIPILPLIGFGVYIGNTGLAATGIAIAIPMLIVVLILLAINNLLGDFVDFIIDFLEKGRGKKSNHTNFDYDSMKENFEDILSSILEELFEKNINIENFKTAKGYEKTGDEPRDYEFFAVDKLAKKFSGEGFVTSKSCDLGIDGYIVCKDSQEIILVQAKHYSKKVGFPEATQYLGTLKFWQKEFQSKFPFPISKMVIAAPNDFSVEAKRVSKSFSEELVLMAITY